MNRLRHRLVREDGFTLIELAVVMVIIGVLVAIAVASYLGARGRAMDARAKANVHEAVTAAAAYWSDHDSYTGMTIPGLSSTYDRGLAGDGLLKLRILGGGSTFCFSEIGEPGTTWYYLPSSGALTSTEPDPACP